MSSERSGAGGSHTALASYVPSCIVEACVVREEADRNRDAAAAVDEEPPKWKPSAAGFLGCVVFVDISGFTKLTERMAEQSDGAERLVAFLNDYFSRLIETVYQHGGDVIKFAGDALLAVWRADHHSQSSRSEERMRVTVARAAQCAVEMMETMNNDEDETQPRLHMGLGCGVLSLLQVGGTDGSWEFLVCGEPLYQISSACAAASPDKTVVSKEAWALIGPMCVGETVTDGGDVRLDAVVDRVEQQSLAGPGRVRQPTPVAIQAFVPEVIQRNLAATQTTWHSEIRAVTVVFVQIKGVRLDSSDCLRRVHKATVILQRAVAKYTGIINKILLDDKGFLVIAGFGLPPAEEEPQLNGVLAAMKVASYLKRIDLCASVGVTTGRAFCGEVGSLVRREYTMIGDVVNTSARLMAAADDDDILCDGATVAAVQHMNHRVTFEELAPLRLKGKRDPVPVWRPSKSVLESSKKKVKSLYTMNLMNVGIQGRQLESVIISCAIEELPRGGSASVVIEGEQGIGKSRVVEEGKRAAIEAGTGLEVFCGCGDPIEKSTPFYVWRPIFQTIFGIQETVEGRAVAEALTQAVDRIKGAPSMVELAPLLNTVLGTHMEETANTSAIQGNERVEAIQRLLMLILVTVSKEVPLVIILEDMHWFDPPSFDLAVILARMKIPNVMMLLSTRPVPVALRDSYERLTTTEIVTVLTLGPLNQAHITDLVCKRLGVVELPPAVDHLIATKSQGNPFFAEEIAYALRDLGVIATEAGVCLLVDEASLAGAESIVGMLDSLQGVITSRMDRLAPAQKHILKVASAFGREFSADILSELIDVGADELENTLDELIALDFIGLVLDDGEGTDAPGATATGATGMAGMMGVGGSNAGFLPATEDGGGGIHLQFTSTLTKDVAYSLMLERQRVKLHGSIAEWYEKHFADDLAGVASALGYHWRKAKEHPRAIKYLIVAAAGSMATFLPDEACKFLRAAANLLSSSSNGSSGGGSNGGGGGNNGAAEVDQYTVGHVAHMLGEAYAMLEKDEAAREQLERAVVVLGGTHPGADSSLAALLEAAREAERVIQARGGPDDGIAAEAAVLLSGGESALGLRGRTAAISRGDRRRR